jgi:hypothetical protein
MPEAYKAYQAASAIGPYTGGLYGGMGPTGQQALDVTRNLAGGVQAQAAPVTQYGQDLLAGKYLSAESNPYLQSYMQAAINPLQQNLMEQILPGLRSGAVASGGYGGSRQGIAEGQSVGRYLQQAGDITSQMAGQAYDAERGRMMQGGDIVQQGMGLQAMQPQMLAQVGQAEQADQQAKMDEALQLYQMQMQQPYAALGPYADLIMGSAGLGGTSSGTNTPAANPLGGAAGGAMMGYQLGGPWGAAAGGVAGALLS